MLVSTAPTADDVTSYDPCEEALDVDVDTPVTVVEDAPPVDKLSRSRVIASSSEKDVSRMLSGFTSLCTIPRR